MYKLKQKAVNTIREPVLNMHYGRGRYPQSQGAYSNIYPMQRGSVPYDGNFHQAIPPHMRGASHTQRPLPPPVPGELYSNVPQFRSHAHPSSFGQPQHQDHFSEQSYGPLTSQSRYPARAYDHPYFTNGESGYSYNPQLHGRVTFWGWVSRKLSVLWNQKELNFTMSKLSLGLLIVGGLILCFLLVFTGFLIALNVYDLGANDVYRHSYQDPYLNEGQNATLALPPFDPNLAYPQDNVSSTYFSPDRARGGNFAQQIQPQRPMNVPSQFGQPMGQSIGQPLVQNSIQPAIASPSFQQNAPYTQGIPRGYAAAPVPVMLQNGQQNGQIQFATQQLPQIPNIPQAPIPVPSQGFGTSNGYRQFAPQQQVTQPQPQPQPFPQQGTFQQNFSR